jgi:hypothetical protein
MSIGDVGLALLNGEDAERINALSMGSSGIHRDSDIHM